MNLPADPIVTAVLVIAVTVTLSVAAYAMGLMTDRA